MLRRTPTPPFETVRGMLIAASLGALAGCNHDPLHDIAHVQDLRVSIDEAVLDLAEPIDQARAPDFVTSRIDQGPNPLLVSLGWRNLWGAGELHVDLLAIDAAG